MNTVITLGISVISVLVINKIFKKSKSVDPDTVLKILAVCFCVIGIFRYPMSDAFVEIVKDFSDPLQTFLRWTYHISYAVIPMSVFFDFKLFRNIASYFCLPVAVLSAFMFDDTFTYFTAEGAGGYYLNTHFRYVYYTLELVLAIIIPVLMQIHHKHVINLKNTREVLLAIGLIPLIMMQMVPSYIFDSIYNGFVLRVGMFQELHLIWLSCLLVEILTLHYAFKHRSEKERYGLLVFLVIAQVMHTTSPFLRGFTFSRLPLQLCNIAAFFYLYMIIKRDKRIYDFCFLSNIVGAAIAMVLIDFQTNVVNFWNIHYIYEHSFVVMVPVLGASLGIFGRVNSKKAIKNMLICFVAYFSFIFVCGTLINGFDTTPDYFPVNHFYMFNPAVAVDYLPFAGFTAAIHWTFGNFEVYPILVVVIFILFIGLNLAFFGIMQAIYKIKDTITARINRGKTTNKVEPKVKMTV